MNSGPGQAPGAGRQRGATYLTPAPRRAAARLAAFISAGLIGGAAVFPAVMSPAALLPPGEDERALAAVAQGLESVDVPEARSVLDAVGTVRLEEVPAPRQAPGAAANESTAGALAAGQLQSLTLSDSEVRLPFDVDWPLTDGFGYRSAPVEGFHDAQDIAAAAGTPVLAVATGVVTEAGWASDGCGFSAKLQHRVGGQDLTSRYCHMEDASHDLRVGQTVPIGAQVGRVGNTGMSFGAHLHLALQLDGQPIDPLPFLRR
ncbi:peptidase M23-like protein [Leucobacter komagatae]|uniref:Peptidase M23-like protein n=1 Tax=Leucobacter komagatae TaxID=55969 RepID=A0A542Y4L6_9MICO|nr:M23 family metallopeptidase [Leucobacter komagatae]TQL43011.1 peptidase M23-like protein [Leucobacter komagatae]